MEQPRNDVQRLPVTGAVLAGGRSMRMGVDKTMLPFEGQPMVARVVDVLGQTCESVVVVTNRPEALESAHLDPDVQIIVDEVPYCGPLGGLTTALATSKHQWVLVVAADMPWVSSDVVRLLWEAREGADVVVPIAEKGVEPLLAFYSTACLEPARAALSSGRRRIISFFKSVRVAEVPVEALRSADPDLRSLVNINTPDELSGAMRVAADSERLVSVMEVSTKRGRGMPSERPITVHLNETEVATMQASPTDLEDLAVGFLLSEGMLNDRDALKSVEADPKRGMVWVTTDESVPDDFSGKTRYMTSGCGKGVTFSSLADARRLTPVEGGACVTASDLYALMGEMARGSDAYRKTGGMHACGLAIDGSLALMREDVGRHNAVDKLLGRAWLDRMPVDGAVLLSTGRISYEMAVKAVRSRIPVVVSRTAVTDLAAELADQLGVTLAGYARGGKLTVYTNPHRIVADDTNEGDQT